VAAGSKRSRLCEPPTEGATARRHIRALEHTPLGDRDEGTRLFMTLHAIFGGCGWQERLRTSARFLARFSAVCPPIVGSTASGRSCTQENRAHQVLHGYGRRLLGARQCECGTVAATETSNRLRPLTQLACISINMAERHPLSQPLFGTAQKPCRAISETEARICGHVVTLAMICSTSSGVMGPMYV